MTPRMIESLVSGDDGAVGTVAAWAIEMPPPDSSATAASD